MIFFEKYYLKKYILYYIMNYIVTKEETRKRGQHYDMRNIRLKKTSKEGDELMLNLAEIKEYYEELKKKV